MFPLILCLSKQALNNSSSSTSLIPWHTILAQTLAPSPAVPHALFGLLSQKMESVQLSHPYSLGDVNTVNIEATNKVIFDKF